MNAAARICYALVAQVRAATARVDDMIADLDAGRAVHGLQFALTTAHNNLRAAERKANQFEFSNKSKDGRIKQLEQQLKDAKERLPSLEDAVRIANRQRQEAVDSNRDALANKQKADRLEAENARLRNDMHTVEERLALIERVVDGEVGPGDVA